MRSIHVVCWDLFTGGRSQQHPTFAGQNQCLPIESMVNCWFKLHNRLVILSSYSSSISRPICKDDLDISWLFFTGIDMISSSNPFSPGCKSWHTMSESLAPKHDRALCVKHGQNPKVSRLRKSSKSPNFNGHILGYAPCSRKRPIDKSG